MELNDGKACDAKSEELVIGTLSELAKKNNGDNSVNSLDIDSTTTYGVSESEGSQPECTPKSPTIPSSSEKSICHSEDRASLVMNKQSLREIELGTADKYIKNEPESSIVVPKESEHQSSPANSTGEKNVSLHKFVVKSLERIDILHDDSTEDYAEKSMEQPSSSQIHGENGE